MGNEIMVKVCEKCGIVNSERAEECENCTAELGEAITSKEAKKLTRKIAKRNAKMKDSIAAEKFSGGGGEDEAPYIPVTPARIVIGVLASLVTLGIVVVTVLLGIFNSYDIGVSLIPSNLIFLLLMAIPIFTCFMPSTMWALSHWNYQVRYDRMPQPSDMGLVFQLIGCVALTLVGAAVFVAELLLLLGAY